MGREGKCWSPMTCCGVRCRLMPVVWPLVLEAGGAMSWDIRILSNILIPSRLV